ncbi:unnamed protein product [Diatraea saccharalis]|uniref:RRM domain-containing protein n=1 Tax=Diatraea saccharalis TaxID=40085 RepID=A0A9N9R7S5_9NEOP|nr:unnamed protein product [Diatraea saccharalis]
MSVIIRLQNLPWSANALDIRNFFRGLSIPEGGVHIVGGELGDAFIAFSTDEDARQAMMLDCGKIKEIQVKLLLSSRSEMHKVIEAARQSVPILTLAASAPAPVVTTAASAPTPIIPTITPFSAALGTNSLTGFGIPGIGNPNEIPQPAVIEPPAPLVSPSAITPNANEEKEEEKVETKRDRDKDRRRSRSRSRSRDRDRKDRKRDRRDRSRSRERRRRDRSRSRDRRDRKRDRKERSRSSDRSPSRRSRDRRERKSPRNSQEKVDDSQSNDSFAAPTSMAGNVINPSMQTQMQPLMQSTNIMMNGLPNDNALQNRYNDPSLADAFNKLQELGKKRNPNAFQGDLRDQNGGGRFQGGRGGAAIRGGTGFRRENRVSRFDNDQPRDVCVAIRNAPNHTSYGDVRRFFPFVIDKHGIKMINDHLGRRTGNIFVKFCDPRSKQLVLQRKHNELKGAQVTVETLDDDAYDAAIDSFLPYREENDEEDPSLIIADDEPKQSFNILKLTDLPTFVKEQDIIKTFSDFSLLSIMLNDCRNTRSKIAFVQFVKPEDAKEAFDRKDRYIFGRRHPTIVPVTDEEYNKQKQIQNERPSEIKEKSQTVEPQVEIQAPRDPRQRRQFDNGTSPKVAPQQPPQAQQPPFFPPGPFPGQPGFVAPFPAAAGAQFGGFPGPTAVDPRSAAANWVARPTLPNPMNQMKHMPASQSAPIDLDDEPLDCVLMKGLPQDATDRTIVSFLSDTGAVPARIHLMLDTNGHPSGDCFCEFRSPQEARMAASKHGQNLEGCRITVDLVGRTVVEEALEGPKQQQEVQEGLLGKAPPTIPGPQPFFDVPQRGFGPRGPYRGRGGFDSSRGGFENRNFESGRGGFDRGYHRGGYEGRGSFRSRGFDRGGRGFERGRGRGFGRGRGGGGFENGRDQAIIQENDPTLEDFGAPGCVVSMENVPFRATIDDILTFFSEFELTQDDVIRRYNERGQPTGDARVAFRTPFDAQRAVKTRHMDNIHDRRINLMIL